MKRSIFIITLILFVLMNGILVSADMKNDDILDISGVETYEKDGTIMVPLREVVEGILGLEVKWIEDTRSVEIGTGPQWTSITIDRNSYFFARVAPFELSQAPEIKDGISYVPIEFFSKVMKYEVLDKPEIPEEDKILSGFIKDIIESDGRIRILVAGDQDIIGLDLALLTITEETVIVDVEGNEFAPGDLNIGTKVRVTLPDIMALSYPPQGAAVKIVVIDDQITIDRTEDEDREDIEYPKITGLIDENSIIANSRIEEFIKEIKENELYEDIELNYEISMLTDDLISIIFRGKFDFYGSEKQFMKSLNINLESGEIIDFKNYFKGDEDSQDKLLEILEQTAREQLNMEFEAEGKQIYFKGSNAIVFYFPLDDSVVYPAELYLPLEDLIDIIN